LLKERGKTAQYDNLVSLQIENFTYYEWRHGKWSSTLSLLLKTHKLASQINQQLALHCQS